MINKYLETENASITIKYSNYIDDFLNNNLDDLLIINIKRFNILVESKNLNELKVILNKYDFKDLPVFIKIHNLNSDYEIVQELKEKYYIVIKSNDINNYYEDIYYEVEVNENNSSKVIELLDKYENVLLDININKNNLKQIYETLDNICSETKREYLMIENIFISKKLIMDCPYNIYVGNEFSNRNYGNMIPRNIYIDENIYASNFKENKFIIGSVNDSLLKVLSESKKAEGYKRFVEYNTKMFINYLNQFPYEIVDIDYLLKEVIDDDTSS